MFVKPSSNFLSIKLIEDITRYQESKKSNIPSSTDMNTVLESIFISKMMVAGKSYVQGCAVERMAELYLRQEPTSEASIDQVIQMLSSGENEESIGEMSMEIIKSLAKAFLKILSKEDLNGKVDLSELSVFSVLHSCTQNAGGLEDLLSCIDTKDFFLVTLAQILTSESELKLTKDIHLEIDGESIVAVKS
jgi:hypothetical protein